MTSGNKVSGTYVSIVSVSPTGLDVISDSKLKGTIILDDQYQEEGQKQFLMFLIRYFVFAYVLDDFQEQLLEEEEAYCAFYVNDEDVDFFLPRWTINFIKTKINRSKRG